MEIDIPDLQDLKFEEICDCRYRGHLSMYVGDKWTQVLRPKQLKYGEPFPKCPTCKGEGSYLTPVGERLIEFLTNRGLVLGGVKKVTDS